MRLRENDESPRPQKRRRAAEPVEPTNAEPTELVEPAEQAAQAAEATVARRSAAGQPSSAFVGVSWHKAVASGRPRSGTILRTSTSGISRRNPGAVETTAGEGRTAPTGERLCRARLPPVGFLFSRGRRLWLWLRC